MEPTSILRGLLLKMEIHANWATDTGGFEKKSASCCGGGYTGQERRRRKKIPSSNDSQVKSKMQNVSHKLSRETTTDFFLTDRAERGFELRLPFIATRVLARKNGRFFFSASKCGQDRRKMSPALWVCWKKRCIYCSGHQSSLGVHWVMTHREKNLLNHRDYKTIQAFEERFMGKQPFLRRSSWLTTNIQFAWEWSANIYQKSSRKFSSLLKQKVGGSGMSNWLHKPLFFPILEA